MREGVPLISVREIGRGTFHIDEKTPRVSASTVTRLSEYVLKEGDIVFARKGGIERNALVRKPQAGWFLGSDGIRLRPPAECDPRYLAYFLRTESVGEWLLQHSTGSTMASLNGATIGRLPISLPSLHEQRVVADYLEVLDDRITLLRETNATLEAIAQALFKSWFVDFDPVRAKMEGRAPEGMDEATAALFPDSFEETELGLLPRGWRYSTVGESFIVTMGQSPPGETYNDDSEGLAFYQGRTDFGFRFPSQRMYCTAPTRIAEIGDTLVSVRAPVGDVNMAIERCCIGRGVAAVRHPGGYRGFTFYAMRGMSQRFQTFDSEGTVFGSINKKDFQALPVISPSVDVLSAYEKVSAPMDSRILGNEEQLRTLTTLRDTLLPRLISGQLRLPEAEATLEEASPA